MHPVAVEPAALPRAALPLLDLAWSVERGLSPVTVGGDLGAALDRFAHVWQREGADIADEAREQCIGLVRAAELYEQLEATLVLGQLR